MKNLMIVCVAAAVVFGCAAEEPARPEKWAVPMTLAGVPNLHKVSDKLYRSAQPTAEGMTNLVALGVKTVVSLRDNHSDSAEIGGLPLKARRICRGYGIMSNMEIDVKSAVAEIASTTDLLERALKLSGLVTTMFQRRDFPLVVVGGSAVEFYTEGGYMSGDIDFCRRSLKAIPPRVMQEVIAELGGKGVSRSWMVCGLCVDLLGLLECETALPMRELETPYGVVKIIPPELALVERILIANYPPSEELAATARKMMVAALNDPRFDWGEAERLAALPDFGVLAELHALREEVANG